MGQLITRELRRLWQSPWQLALVSYLPLLGTLALWWLFSAGLPRALPVAVVDQDQSQLSRMLVRQLSANSVISPVSYQDIGQAQAAMERAEAYAMVVLPFKLNQDLMIGHQPSIDIRYNAQFLLVGKLLSSQIQLSLADGLKQKARLKQLASGVPPVQAEINLNLIETQSSALYNANNNYVAFLVPPILIALVQIVAMLVFANALTEELRRETQAEWFSLGTYRVLLSKILVYTPLPMLQLGLVYAWLYGYLGLPMRGCLGQLLLAQLVMLLAVWLIVLAIFALLQDSARVISFCTALFAPSFAFMGVTFPTHEMPLLAQWWRQIMPSSHYVDTHIGVIAYGQETQALISQLSSYWGFLLLLPVVALMLAKMRREQTGEQLDQAQITEGQG
ncbi:ABC transporter permease [Shewanella alkalitolerans]|uniref:ABC transporter permease n=1 Tax=Shewanella alkalitolerans TaxID=2864209 RepID=UPI001C65F973|nr:ABC transporter permease [Shewanella alkalitolerans]QYJ98070.1 ABC transporter permease [Shewanella alkalitolerans]